MRNIPLVLLVLACAVLIPNAGDAETPIPLDVRQALDRIAESTAATSGERLGVMTDRPLYRPGDTVWFRTWRAVDGPGPTGSTSVTATLIDGRGAEADQLTFPESGGVGLGQITLAASLPGGHYTLRFAAGTASVERPIIIEAGALPEFRTTLRFARATHGPGQWVTASVAVARRAGAPLSDRPVEAVVAVDGREVRTLQGRTDAEGRATLRVQLPEGAMADARLSVRVTDAAGVAALTRAIPLTPPAPSVSVLPEGGDLIVGLPGRVYLAARGPAGRPADVSGRVLDDRDRQVAEVKTVIDGRARFELTPDADRQYRVVLDGGGVTPVPAARPDGCALATVDDPEDTRPTIGVDVRCTSNRTVALVASRRSRVMHAIAVEAGPAKGARVELNDDGRRGPVTITALAADGDPLAERVVFRHRARALGISVSVDREHAAPGEEVEFTVRAVEPDGAPAAADLALAVVDDALLSLADDRAPDLVGQMLLLPTVRHRVERVGRYLAPGVEAGRALDLLMGTAGYRRFAWLGPGLLPDTDRDGIGDRVDACPEAPETFDGVADDDGCPDARRQPTLYRRPLPPPRAPHGVTVTRPNDDVSVPNKVVITSSRIEIRERIYFRPSRAQIRPVSYPLLDEVAQVLRENLQIRLIEIEGHTDASGREWVNMRLSKRRAQAVLRALVDRGVEPDRLIARGYGETRPLTLGKTADERAVNRRVELTILEMDGRGYRGQRNRVRIFPAPPAPTPERDDFRDTIAWVPRVTLDAKGVGRVRVRLSDALTGFRAVVQGISGGHVGRGDAIVSTRRPLMVSADLPTRMVVGDRIEVPITLTNATGQAMTPTLKVTAPDGLRLDVPAVGSIAAGARQTVSLTLEAAGVGRAAVDIDVQGGAWSDAMRRDIDVFGRGFPWRAYLAGALAAGATQTIELPMPSDARDARARIELVSSAFLSLTEAADAIVRMPSGCFEQTSAGHHPNVLALAVLSRPDAPPVAPERLASIRSMVEAGARRLAGFEAPSGGFSMYGGPPGRVDLTAYAITQFNDHPGSIDPALMARAGRWLAAQPPVERQGARSRAGAVWVDRALVQSGHADPARLDGIAERVRSSADPYVLAISMQTLADAGDATRLDQARAGVTRLIEMQGDDGFWAGASGLMGGGQAGVRIETTGLAVQALARLGAAESARAKAVAALHASLRGGRWVTTQATVQALGAIVAHGAPDPVPKPGEVIVEIAGEVVHRAPRDSLTRAVMRVDIPTEALSRSSTVTLRQTGGALLRWTAVGRATTERPGAEGPSALALRTTLDRTALKVGEAATLTAWAKSQTGGALDDPLIRLALPALLEPDRSQLKMWTESGRVALAEVRPGEVVLYLHRIEGEVSFPLTVTARRAGKARGAASSAYPYYAPDPAWADPVEVSVE